MPNIKVVDIFGVDSCLEAKYGVSSSIVSSCSTDSSSGVVGGFEACVFLGFLWFSYGLSADALSFPMEEIKLHDVSSYQLNCS